MTQTEQQVAREQQARITEHRSGALRCVPTASLALERMSRESVPAALVLAVKGGQSA